MSFKLVRTDSEDGQKISLSTGTHVIGRGKFLHCDDKRISRNHAELLVSDDSVTLKAIHTNPLFIKKAAQDIEVLRESCAKELYNGDRFGMLPDSHWFEVIYNSSQESPNVDIPVKNESPTINKTECNNDDTAKPDSLSMLGSDTEELQSTQNFQLEKWSIKHETTELNQTNDQLNTTDALDDDAKNQLSNIECAQPKRNHSQSDTDCDDPVKKIKTEQSVKLEPSDAQAGPSNEQDMDTSNANAGDAQPSSPQMPQSPAKPQAALRERCMYGANCYRKNPQHKAQFSHPQDADWGPGQLGQCPWGSTCTRRDPRHWRDHQHPPGVHPPQPGQPRNRQPGMQVVERRGNIYYINANAVNFYDDHFQVEDSDGDSVDYDYEF